MKKTTIFLLQWLGWGFTLGTILLLEPLRWIVDIERKNATSSPVEKGSVVAMIVILIVISFSIARFTSKKIANAANGSFVKKALLFIPLAGLGICIYAFMNPKWVNGLNNKREVINNQFTVGSYPEIEQLKQLKEDGYIGVICLLHPAVVPFEPVLIEKEKKNAAQAGLEFVNIPMLPWISDNNGSIDSLKRFISKPHGKYYLHCYLGRDRVQAAAKIIQQADKTIMDKSFKIGTDLSSNKLERGSIEQVEKGVFLSPFPTKEEYFHLVPNIVHVVSLCNLNDREASLRNKEEKQWLQPYNIGLSTFKVSEVTGIAEMTKVVNEIKKLPKPILIHSFFTDDKEMLLFKKIYIEGSNK